MCVNFFSELKEENRGVWHLALSLLMDNDEASIVRENCAFLLANLLSHTVSHTDRTLVTSLIPNTMRKVSRSDYRLSYIITDFRVKMKWPQFSIF